MVAVISADIIDSTSLSKEDYTLLIHAVREELDRIEDSVKDSWGRIVRGDFIECYLPKPQDSLRIALLIKTKIKSLELRSLKAASPLKTYGVRIAIGVGAMKIIDKAHDIMDGEAIYLSGRKIDKKEPYYRGCLHFCMNDGDATSYLETICVLVDALVNKLTAKQANIIYYKLLNTTEIDIAKKLNLVQSTVNQHSTTSPWYAIETALRSFEKAKF